MLHDHEDNLFLQQWGTINEPVYNMQGTAYLLRDEPKAAIRTFYSTMACAFSHSVFEPVEHRWGWGQYFGPPSTDGAWFELYRNLLIREQDDDTLLLCQATPRAWLAPGRRIEVRRAPTYYGPLSFTTESRADAGEITTTLDLPARKQPAALFVRFRHPREKPLRAATVNGRAWKDFDPAKEWCVSRSRKQADGSSPPNTEGATRRQMAPALHPPRPPAPRSGLIQLKVFELQLADALISGLVSSGAVIRSRRGARRMDGCPERNRCSTTAGPGGWRGGPGFTVTDGSAGASLVTRHAPGLSPSVTSRAAKVAGSLGQATR